jgi:NACalpha-BTF3-like transcription factor
MAGKRKHRPHLQTYGRTNNYLHSHQRVSFLRAQEFFSPNGNRPSQDLEIAPERVHETGAPQPTRTQPDQKVRQGLTAKKRLTQSTLEQTQTAKSTASSTERTSAAMAIQPSEDDVGSVMAITDCSRDQAVRYLKVKKDVSAAIGAIMDGEDISKEEQSSSWDEGAWNTDRDGNVNMGDNNLRPLGGTSTAPTRVPSPAMGMGVPASRDDEDAQLAQALAASREEGQWSQQQESGVLHTDGTEQAYGPTNKDQSAHDRQWGMVLSSQGASSEIVPDIERPEERKNAEGEPRFLKTLPSGDYLPNFLTIGHSIPAVREALLLRDYIQAQYGKDSEWWRGHPIALPKIVHTENGAPADAEIDKFDEFLAETQRLMATLDTSQRSYASVNALTKTELLLSAASLPPMKGFIAKFCSAVEARTDKYKEVTTLFETYIGTTNPAGMGVPFATVFDLEVNTIGEDRAQLMEVLDGLLWDVDTEGYEQRDNYIEHAGGILVMQAKQTDPFAQKLQLEIPSTLYIDKYLQKNVDISRPVRVEIAREKERVAKINEIEKKLTKWQMPGQQIDARAMLQHTLGHFSGKNIADVENADREHGNVANSTSTPEQPHYAEIAAKLEVIIANVDKKLERLAEQKESIQKTISRLSKSSPSQLEQEGLKERYTLMGVATKPSITYVLRPKENRDEDDDLMSTENEDEITPDGMQWWRIEYAVNGTQPRISKAKVEGDIVIQAVEVEHTSALLIYASDSAVDESKYDNSLPPALQAFVDDDNLNFNVELHDSTHNHPPPSYDFTLDSDIRQSIEPGRRASMDSTCAERGGASGRGSPYFDEAPPGAGLPPAHTSSTRHIEDQELEVTEIRLTPPQDMEHHEMVETKHEPFVPGLQQRQREGDGDADMEDVRGAK